MKQLSTLILICASVLAAQSHSQGLLHTPIGGTLRRIFGSLFAPEPPYSSSGFLWKIQLTYDHTKIGAGVEDENDFPTLIYISDPSIRTVGNGGKVSDPGGADLLPFTDSSCATQPANALAFYDGANGVAEIWAKLNLSHTSDSQVYVCTGNASPPSRNTTAVWDTNFQAVYQFPNGGSLSLADSTSNAYSLANHGATAGAGMIGGGVSIASGQYLTSPTITAPTNQATMSAWFRTSGTGNWQTIVLAQSAYTYAIQINNNNYAHGGWDYASGSPCLNAGSTVLTDGLWHQVAFAYNGSQGMLYVDGLQSGSPQTCTFLSPYTSFTIGSPNPFVGAMDQVEISTTARSAGWISTEYKNLTSPGSFGSAGFWRFGAWTTTSGGLPIVM